jgi:tRNA G10  N-methylase Trm11
MQPRYLPQDGLLDFGSDIGIRHRWFSESSFGHPAKLHLGLLQYLIDRYTLPGETLCDPMAGSGSLLLAALSARHVIVRDVESRWVTVMQHNAERIREEAGLFVGTMSVTRADARLPWEFRCDHVICSPPYGCEMSGRPSAKKGLAYRLAKYPHDRRWEQYLSHPNRGTVGMLTFHYGTTPGQLGSRRGKRYWQAMEAIYRQAHRAIRPGGRLILIIKDHIRDGRRVPTADLTVDLCETLGFRFTERLQRRVYPLSLWQRRRKEQGQPVVEEEDILILARLLR